MKLGLLAQYLKLGIPHLVMVEGSEPMFEGGWCLKAIVSTIRMKKDEKVVMINDRKAGDSGNAGVRKER